MEGNNNYDQLLPQSRDNLLTDLAQDEQLLKEYQQYQGKSIESQPIDLSETIKPKPEPKKTKKKVEPKKKKSQVPYLSYLLTAFALFIVFVIMLYPKTAPMFNKVGSSESMTGIAIRGGILMAVYLGLTFAFKWFC